MACQVPDMPTTLLTRHIHLALLCLLASMPAAHAQPTATDLAAMQQAIAELQAQNRALALRLQALEAEKAAHQARPQPAAAPGGAPAAEATSTEALANRVSALEFTKIAQEDATRAIIRDSLSKVGSKINESATFGGALEMLAGRSRDFSGTRQSALRLNTSELDFEIQANAWASAKLVLEYIDGSNAQFTNLRGIDISVDRVIVDKAVLTLGDLQRFPLQLQAGRMALAFGSSTGVHRADTLAIEGPLTVDAFQMRRTAIGLGFGLPTPKLARPPLPVVVPTVQPQVLSPLLHALGRQLGYAPPPTRPKTPLPVPAPVEPPPFYGSLFVYEAHNGGVARSFFRNVNARLGYRAGGHCGKPYSSLRASDLCPWSLDVNVDYNNSLFSSDFLEAEYQPFLQQFGPVRGLASTAKLALGPVMLVGEWAGTLSTANFADDLGKRHRIRPGAWQASVGYQFDWNPWIEAVGSQGSYLALGYSRTRDLAGATQVVNGERLRVGALPKTRWTLTAGEWLQEGLKVQLEYFHTQDFSSNEGGTGASGNGLQMTLTYTW